MISRLGTRDLTSAHFRASVSAGLAYRILQNLSGDDTLTDHGHFALTSINHSAPRLPSHITDTHTQFVSRQQQQQRQRVDLSRPDLVPASLPSFFQTRHLPLRLSTTGSTASDSCLVLSCLVFKRPCLQHLPPSLITHCRPVESDWSRAAV